MNNEVLKQKAVGGLPEQQILIEAWDPESRQYRPNGTATMGGWTL